MNELNTLFHCMHTTAYTKYIIRNSQYNTKYTINTHNVSSFFNTWLACLQAFSVLEHIYQHHFFGCNLDHVSPSE
jgi:hypothetical protein